MRNARFAQRCIECFDLLDETYGFDKSGQSVNISKQIHQAAARGYQTAPEAYERGRPGYPSSSIDSMKDVLQISPTTTVVDLGAGTGKLAASLADSRANILAIEPVSAMRDKFSENLPDIPIFEGTAEAIPLRDLSVDVVCVGQAFHWFEPHSALLEIHRILKPEGRLGLIWNVRDESIEWVAELTKIIDSCEHDVPRYQTMNWKAAFEGSSLFQPLKKIQFRHSQKGDLQMMVDRVSSISFIATLPPKKKDILLSQVIELISTHPQTCGKTEIELPYRTDLYWTHKIET